jgi:hypothetical protein
MMLERRRTLGELVSDAFALYGAQVRTYLAIALAVVVPVDLVVLGIGMGQLGAAYDTEVTQSQLLLELGVSYLLTTPLVTSMVIVALRSGSGAGRAPRAAAGDAFGTTAAAATRTPREAIQAGLDLFAPVLLAMVMYAVIVMVGFVLLIIPGVIAAVRLLFVVQAVVIDGHRGPAALEHSWRLTRGSFWRTFGIVLLAGLGGALAGSLLQVPFVAIAQAADLEAISLLGRMVADVAILPIVAIVTTLLYLDLRERDGERDQPEKPA